MLMCHDGLPVATEHVACETLLQEKQCYILKLDALGLRKTAVYQQNEREVQHPRHNEDPPRDILNRNRRNLEAYL